jgi:dTDP-4-dehydrorhamnose reductase
MRGLALAGCDVVGSGYHRAEEGGLKKVDARREEAVESLFEDVEPAVVVNAVGERRPEFWNPETLEEVNVHTAANAARACRRRDSWLVHISSDYVFDGSCPPYRPENERRPVNAYGFAKMRAEDEVMAELPAATILRLPVLYGPVRYMEESNMTSLVPLVMKGTPAVVDDWAIRYPTLTTDVAHVVVGMLAHNERLRGRVCHWSANEALTKYAMAALIGQMLGFSTDHLTPDTTPSSSRPRDTLLDVSLLHDMGVAYRTPLHSALPEVLHHALEIADARQS